MFSGIIECTGQVSAFERVGEHARIRVTPSLPGQPATSSPWAAPGDSVAVNGCCLTVAGEFMDFFVSSETLSLTNLEALRPGARVNLERALPVGGRFAGHIVQGHVDAVAKLARLEPEGDSWKLWFEIPEQLQKYCVPKGSVALNGISLTINEITHNLLRVQIIPYTWSNTNLCSLQVGDYVNLEVDILAKYMERLCSKT